MSAPAHEIVLASAGTGKTFRLTNRYIELLARGEPPGAILATTFTRKAAGEILQRVLGALAGAACGAEQLEALRTFADPSLTHERCAALAGELIEALPRLSILTIDAFFARAARCFALELGVPGSMRMLEDHADAALRAEAISRALEQEDADELIELLLMFHGETAGRSVHEPLLDKLNKAHAAYLETEGDPDAWRGPAPDPPPLSADRFEGVAESLQHVELPTNQKGQVNGHWLRAHNTTLRQVESDQWEAMLDAGLPKAIIEAGSGTPTFYKREVSPEVLRAYEPIIEHARSVLLARFAGRQRATRRLLERFDGAYSELKRAEGACRFDDVPRLLRRAEVMGVSDLLYFRLDARFRHVLLDEFQDTSREQFELLEPLLDEILSQDEGRSVFVVGDVKQSLYGWRQAEPGLLEHLPRRWPQLRLESLDRSQRSAQSVLDAVNTVFGALGENPALAGDDAAGPWIDRFRAHEAADRKAHLRGFARLSVVDAPPSRTKDEPDRAALELACRRVGAIRVGAPRARIAVLLRRNARVGEAIHVLREAGIEASQEGGAPLTDAAPVAGALSALRLAEHPGDSAALFHLGTSPLGEGLGIGDPLDAASGPRVASRVRARLMRDGYAGMLEWLLRGLEGRLTRRERERCEQLLTLASRADAEAMPATRPMAFVERVEASRQDAPGDEPVRVMTIHAAKGLEFDAVILPELEEPFEGRPGAVILERADPTSPAHAVSLYPNQLMQSLDERLAAMHERHRARQIEEQLCALYVAMTRAVHHVELIIHARDKPDAGRMLADVVRGAMAPDTTPEPGAELWTCGTEAWTEDFAHAGEAEPDVTPERGAEADRAPGAGPREIPLRFARPRAHRSDRLARRSPSDLEGAGAIDLHDVLGARASAGAEAGTILHAWFERVGWLDEAGEPEDDALIAAARELGADEDAAGALIERFRAALLRPEVRAVLSRSRYSAGEVELERECPFAVRLDQASGGSNPAEPALVTGRFDRLVIERDGSGPDAGGIAGAEVLDFKTDAIESERALDERVEGYRPQLEAYRAAAAATLGLSTDRARAALVFTSLGRVIELEPREPNP